MTGNAPATDSTHTPRAREEVEDPGPGNEKEATRLATPEVRRMTDELVRKFYAEAMGNGPEGTIVPAHERKHAAKSYVAVLDKWLVLEGQPTQIVELQTEQTPALLELAARLSMIQKRSA